MKNSLSQWLKICIILGLFLAIFGCTQSNAFSSSNMNNTPPINDGNSNSALVNSAGNPSGQPPTDANNALGDITNTTTDNSLTSPDTNLITEIAGLNCNTIFPMDVLIPSFQKVNFPPVTTSHLDNYLICTSNSQNNYAAALTLQADFQGNLLYLTNMATTLDSNLNCSITSIGYAANECTELGNSQGQDLAEILFTTSNNKYDIIVGISAPAGSTPIDKLQTIAEQMAKEADLKLTS